VVRNAANFLAERKVIVRRAEVGFFPEHESETQDKSAREKHDVQVAIPGILRRRAGICGSFRAATDIPFIVETRSSSGKVELEFEFLCGTGKEG